MLIIILNTMEIKDINFERLKQVFDKKWLDKVSNILTNYTGPISNDFFSNAGLFRRKWEGYNISRNDILYFNNLLYPPNIAILDYILDNKVFFENKLLVDNGCGLGVLSVFLNKLNLDCFNYDKFVHLMGKYYKNYNFFLRDINKEMNTNINLISKKLPDKKFDVVFCSGAPISNEKLTNNGIYLLDAYKEDAKLEDTKHINFELIAKYTCLEVRSNYLKP
tara:strand:+ start:3916 stop:4578 length:663 start_codon:yes stop_codon:yes gene_type:complete